MIPKRIDIAPDNDDFGRLANYISAAPDEDEKREDLWIENCNAGEGLNDLALAIDEVKATQSLNTKSKACKTYHLMISFRDEHPPLDVLKDIEREFAKALGYAEHQRIVGTHVNTKNFHMHIAINKVHPTTLKMHMPHRDFKILERVSRAMEQKHGLKVDLGRADKMEMDRRPQKARDKEAHSWEQSFDGYVRERKDELMAVLNQAKDWRDLHEVLSGYSLELQRQGNGLVIANTRGQHCIKASSLDRLFSRKALEKRLGAFRPVTHNLQVEPAPAQPPAVSSPATRRNFDTYLREHKDELTEAMQRSTDWGTLHRHLAHHGLQLRVRGNGLVIASGKHTVKASILDRSCSKAGLEARLGPFQIAVRQQLQASRSSSGQMRTGSKPKHGPGMSWPQRQQWYRKRPITRHPGQGRLWRRYLVGHQKRSSLVVRAYKTWREFLQYEALNDPLAMAIIVSQRKILQALNPVPALKKGLDLIR